MQNRTLAAQLAAEPTGSIVVLDGWIHRRRMLAHVSFLVLRDRSGMARVVVKEPPARAVLDGLGEESVVRVTGTVHANPAAPAGVEVIDPVIVPLGEPAATPPLELWRPNVSGGLASRLDHAPVALRHPRAQHSWRIAATSMRGFRETLTEAGFVEITTPKIVGTATESGSNVFEMDYFGQPGFLAQSPQFFKQMMVGAHERVFEVGPVFRAEPHDTVRHLAQYTSLDVEFGFIQDHRDVIAQLRDVLAGMIRSIATYAAASVEALEVELPSVPGVIPRVHFADALRIVGAAPDEPDLEPAHERALSQWALAEFGSEFLAVEGYPMRKRPFYTHPQPDDPRWSNSFDLLFRGLELTTGGQRLHRRSDYRTALAAAGEREEDFAAYLSAFEHGMPPHGGFAIGLERWVARLLRVTNVREVTLFPRDLHRLTP
ncbi:aspartate--tRNA(Asn) ligase [Rudaeicoccus suwonensis]|uniref:Aspartate--tRNA(Asp/Asn) ligase n=1 Tax=Rudaeicoccus suwonensis TaxID=657409 RepID=A0A561EBV8_9MICO|nr:aspartate--tRNA(Asn) ligase [Rudaeicoccus suwonensis]TWE13099.1 aspartyl-tRNA synthetase [Rudaeicoccus suwonensis]